MSEYKYSPKAIPSAQAIIDMKIARSNVLLRHFNKEGIDVGSIDKCVDTPNLLLYEARIAKIYWRVYRSLLPDWIEYKGRKPQYKDITNILLDIGYHHLNNTVSNLCDKHDIATALSLIHVPHTGDAKPLVYDLMELFRADVVDITVLTWLRQKKRPITKLSQKHIAHFVNDLNERLSQKHYLRLFKQCHNYKYYMELQVLKFISAVNHKKVFNPIYLPSRHDTRCTCKNCKV